MSTVDLSDLDEVFAQTEAPSESKSFDEPPDGRYNVQVAKAEIKTSKNGNRYLSLQLRILDGDHEGRYLFHRCMLVTRQNLTFLRKDLKTMGVELEKASDLPSKLDALLDKQLRTKKVTKADGRSNIFIDALITDPPLDEIKF